MTELSSGSWSLVTWNTAHRQAKLDHQVSAISRLGPDVIALQEVTTGTLARFRDALHDEGFEFILDSVGKSRGPRQYGCLIASRHPLEPATPLPLPWAEKSCSVLAKLPNGLARAHSSGIRD